MKYIKNNGFLMKLDIQLQDLTCRRVRKLRTYTV